jgi:hypothetical protein
MKDIRFYLEHDTPAKRRKGEHNGNVFAACVPDSRPRIGWEGLGAIFEHPNSPVAYTSCDAGYLRQCKRISEAKAREIHPRLFVVLEVCV